MRNNYPVVFFVFKRPETTIRFLDTMQDSGVKKIYVFADGPRNKVEKLETDRVRNNIEMFIANNADIEIKTRFSTKNLGLKSNIINGLNSVFTKEEAVIILEDDCLPTPDFFRFMSDMLTKYKVDKRIMSINGTSVGGNFKYSYDFTKYAQCWGWATWKRAWKLYDPELSEFNPRTWKVLAQKANLSRLMTWYWLCILALSKAGKINTWDYQWSYAHFQHRGLAIAPSTNLITNIGFDEAATNTNYKISAANMPAKKLSWPLLHPNFIAENSSVSKKIETNFYSHLIPILGMIRQYVSWVWSKYADRH